MGIYCKNCKWVREIGQSVFLGTPKLLFCDEPTNLKIHNRFVSPEITNKEKCSEKNSEGTCNTYKRKWWKFWITK